MRRALLLCAALLGGCTLQYSKSKALEGSSGSAGSGTTGSSSSASSSGSGSTSGSGSSGTSGGQVCQGSAAPPPAVACGGGPLGSPFLGPEQYGPPTDVALQPATLCGGAAWLTAGLDSNGIVSVQVMRFDGGGMSVGPMIEPDGGYGGGQLMAPVDLYGDGQVELVLFGNVIDVFQFGEGDVPSLRQRIDFEAMIPSSPDLNQLVAYDMNHDGKLDLLGHDNADGTLLLINQGGGTFTPAAASIDWGNAPSIITADIAGDGHPLIFVTRGIDATDGGQGTGELAVFDGSTEPIATYQPPVSTYGMFEFAQDLDGDGLLDVVAIAPDRGFSVFYGLPDAGFGRVASLDIGAATSRNALSAVAMGDFNLDCLPDAVVAAYSDLYFYQGLPDGGFDVHPVADGGNGVDHLNYSLGSVANVRGFIVDANGDSKPDLLWSIGSGNENVADLVPQE